MEYDVQIDLLIRNPDLALDRIAAVLGVEPDTALQRGERKPELNLPRDPFWSKRSTPAARDAGLSDHWAWLARIFAGKEHLIRQIAGAGQVRLTIIVDGSCRVPSILIPREMIAFAAAVGADIDVDVYQ